MILFSDSPTAPTTRYVLSNTTLAKRDRVTFDDNNSPTDYTPPVCFVTAPSSAPPRRGRGRGSAGRRPGGDRLRRPAADHLDRATAPSTAPAGPCITASSRSTSAPAPSGRPAHPGPPPLARSSGPGRGRCAWRGRPSRADDVPDQRPSIAREPVNAVTYWHVELDVAHDILLAEAFPPRATSTGADRPFFTEGSDHALHNPDFVVPGLAARAGRSRSTVRWSRPSGRGSRACSRRRSAPAAAGTRAERFAWIIG